MDIHLKPYRCKAQTCEFYSFSSMTGLLRHEREVHAMHGHGEKPFLCTFEGCERGAPGNGFPRHWNLSDHMKRVHNHSPNQYSRLCSKHKHEDSEKSSSETPPVTVLTIIGKQSAPVQTISWREQLHHQHQVLQSKLQNLPDFYDPNAKGMVRDAHETLLKLMATSLIDPSMEMGH